MGRALTGDDVCDGGAALGHSVHDLVPDLAVRVSRGAEERGEQQSRAKTSEVRPIRLPADDRPDRDESAEHLEAQPQDG